MFDEMPRVAARSLEEGTRKLAKEGEQDEAEEELEPRLLKRPRSSDEVSTYLHKRCKAEGCTKFYRSGSRYCVMHGGGRRCAANDCPKSAQGTTTFCSRHGGGNRCQVKGCAKGARGRSSYCIAHSELGLMNAEFALQLCHFDGCPSIARGRGRGREAFCISHRKLSQCIGGLPSPSSSSTDRSLIGSLCKDGSTSKSVSSSSGGGGGGSGSSTSGSSSSGSSSNGDSSSGMHSVNRSAKSSASTRTATSSPALVPGSDETFAFSFGLCTGSGLELGSSCGRPDMRCARTRIAQELPAQLCVGTGLEFGSFRLTRPAPLLASSLLEGDENERLRGSASALRGELCRSLLALQPDDVKESTMLRLRQGGLAAAGLLASCLSPIGTASSLSAVGPQLNSPELRVAQAERRLADGASEHCAASWRPAEGPSFLRLLDEQSPRHNVSIVSPLARTVRELPISRAAFSAGLQVKREMSVGSCVDLLTHEPLLRMLIDSP